MTLIPDDQIERIARELGIPVERLKLEMLQLEQSLRQPFDHNRFDAELRAALEKLNRS